MFRIWSTVQSLRRSDVYSNQGVALAFALCLGMIFLMSLRPVC